MKRQIEDRLAALESDRKAVARFDVHYPDGTTHEVVFFEALEAAMEIPPRATRIEEVSPRHGELCGLLNALLSL